MKTLVVGNSSAAVSAVKEIIGKNEGGQVTLFATEGVLPYDRALLPSLAAGAVKEAKLHYVPEEFFKEHDVHVIGTEQLARISVKRKYLSTVNKTQFPYDRLVLVDTGVFILPLVKGLQKQGVFSCWDLTSVKAMMKELPFTDNITVVVTTVQGLNMACALGQLKKEVTIIAPGNGVLSAMFDDETSSLLKQVLEGKGIRVVDGNTIEEILGDTGVKAVKLTSGKVIASEMVVVDEVRADIRMLSEPDLTASDEIRIEECFKPLAMPFAPMDFGLNILQGFCAGWTKLPEEGREYLRFDGPQNIYKKIFVHGEHLAGAVLFNAPASRDKILDAIRQQTGITGTEEALLD